MANLFFVRHGVTLNNVNRYFNGGGTESILLPEGYEMAQKLGKYLSSISFTKAYVSPQRRALQTLEYLLKAHGGTPKIIPTELLREMRFGDWEETSIDEKKGHPEFTNMYYNLEQYDPSEFKGESYFSVAERGKNFVESLSYDSGENYLIVGHGTMLMMLMQKLRGRSIAQSRDDGVLKNTSLSIFSSTDGKDFIEKMWNFTDYQNEKETSYE